MWSSLADDVFKSGCWLATVPPGLEIRQGNDLLDLSIGDQLPHSIKLLMRCQDQTAAMSGCQDGRWSHSLPVFRSTAGEEDYSGKHWSLRTKENLNSPLDSHVHFLLVWNILWRAVLGQLDVLGSWLSSLEQLFTWTVLLRGGEETQAGDGPTCTRSILQVSLWNREYTSLYEIFQSSML